MGTNSSAVAEATLGLTSAPVDPLRYDGHTADESESTGIICRFVPDGARVLDVGCGTGSMSKLVRDLRHATVIGIEPNPERAGLARQRGIDVHVGVLNAQTSATLGDFDAVVFADVLEHLEDPAATLRTARSVLRRGGVVVASVPNVAHWTVRWNLLLGRFDYQPVGIMDATHLRWFTRRSIHSLFGAAGFTVQTYTVSAGMWMPEYNTRAPWRWMAPDSRNRAIIAGVRRWPGLFGCQHVVRATVSGQ